MPLLSAPLGLASGSGLGLPVGGWTLLALLEANDDDIAVPAALRPTVRKAEQALSLTEGPRLASRLTAWSACRTATSPPSP